ncbi:MAG: twin-arginine translocase TatA/TatE family subunit [Gammaproteobacteria bacterium]
MFEIGFWELALLFGLGLVVLGPEKLPKVADQLGRYAGQARRMARTFTDQIRDEIAAEERRATSSTTASTGTTAEQDVPAFSRPGVDDLIPKAAEPAPATASTEALAVESLAAGSAAAESLDQVQLPPHG